MFADGHYCTLHLLFSVFCDSCKFYDSRKFMTPVGRSLIAAHWQVVISGQWQADHSQLLLISGQWQTDHSQLLHWLLSIQVKEVIVLLICPISWTLGAAELVQHSLQCFWYCVFGQVVAKSLSAEKSSTGLYMGKYDIHPVLHIAPIMNKQAVNSWTL
jgi:hypothetical protein